MAPLAPIFKKAYWSLAAAGAAYAALMLCLTNATIQRNALYANNIVDAWWASVDKAQAYGFAKNQVTRFNITTPDHELLYAWHVLPLNVYAEHEEELVAEPSESVRDFTQTKAFKLLTEDPNARVVLNFHGNAGHLAQGWRTETYRSMTALPNTHLLTIDYRGFGRSTGAPSETGLITDGVALAAYALQTLGIPPSRIVILGQSLGTAVASAVGLHFADPRAAQASLPTGPMDIVEHSTAETETDMAQPVDFAGLVLVAPFTSLPVLVESYRIFGLLPLLSPLRPYPRIQNWLRRHIVDTWDTLGRVTALVSSVTAAAAKDETNRRLRLHIVHAKDDFDIRWTLGETLYKAASAALVGAGEAEAGATVVQDQVVEADGGRSGMARSAKNARGQEVRMDLLAYGGHNRVVTFAPVSLAVQRAFDAAEAAV